MIVIPFLLSLLMGRTIDLKTYNIRGDVYDPDLYDEIPIRMYNSTYTILEDNVFPYSYVGIPSDLVLRFKTNHLHSASGLMGLDGLLRENSWKENSVVVAVTSMYQTVSRTIKPNAPTLDNWTDRVDRQQTHYVSTTFYGGWSVILFRYICSADEDQYTVRNTLRAHLYNSGIMNEKTVENWNKAHLEIKKNRELSGQIKVDSVKYSSLPLSEDISTPDRLLTTLKTFQNDIGDLGQPMFVILKPLHDLDTRYPVVKENTDIEMKFDELDGLLDDLKQTKSSMRSWLSTTLADFSEKEEQQVSKIFSYISNCIQLFDDISIDASVYRPMDIKKIEKSMIAYNKGLRKGVPSYQMLFKRLKEDLDPQCTESFGYRIKGTLKVSDHEKLHLGEMRGGLKECRTECVAEPRCRAIGYAEEIPLLDFQEEQFKTVKKYKQCWIYFRSSSTATVIPSKNEISTQVYNRKCY